MGVSLSVVVPAWNAAEVIPEQLEALARQACPEPWEVIVADNGSSDATASVAAAFQARLPALRVVAAGDRRRASHARNVGAAAAAGSALAFCDADDVVGEGWLAAMVSALQQHELVASCFEARRLNPGWVYESRRNLQTNGLRRYAYPPFLPHAGGGGLGVRRSLFDRISGFDESLPQLEDTDFCWRAQLAGATLHFAPDAVYYVRYRANLRAMVQQALSYAEHNVVLYKRYRPLGMPALTWRQSGRAWLELGKRLCRIRSQRQWIAFVWQFAWRLGRVKGSLQSRVWAL
jgi:glycosyltransferase involved in cell wall biosynthesis